MSKKLTTIPVLLFLELAMFLGMDLFLSGFPIYLTMLGGREDLVGILFGFFMLSAIFFRPLLARIGQRHGQKWVLLVGGLVALTAPWLYLATSNFWLLILVRIFHGIVPAAFITASKLLIIAECGEEKKSMGVGLFGMVGGLSLMFGPYLGVYLLTEVSVIWWLATASLFGLLAVGMWGFVYHSVDEVLTTEHTAKFRPTTILIPLLANGLMAIGFGTVLTFVSTYALSLGYKNPGQFFSVLSVMTIIARLGFGMFGDRFPKKKLMMLGGACYGLGLLLLAFPPTPGWLVASAAPLGLGFFTSLDALFVYVADTVEFEHRAVATAYMVNFIDVGLATASMVLGFVVVYSSYQVLYLVALACALIAIGLLYKHVQPDEVGKRVLVTSQGYPKS